MGLEYRRRETVYWEKAIGKTGCSQKGWGWQGKVAGKGAYAGAGLQGMGSSRYAWEGQHRQVTNVPLSPHTPHTRACYRWGKGVGCGYKAGKRLKQSCPNFGKQVLGKAGKGVQVGLGQWRWQGKVVLGMFFKGKV